MAEKEEYNSTHDGPTIDAAVTQAKPGGTLDSRLRLSLYTSLEQIGITVGSETMEAIALALPNNSILEASCGGDNNGAADGTGFPVISGSALRYGILRVSKIGGYDRVSFEFRVKELASRLFAGFYSSTDGWSGWKKVYTEGSKPTASEVGAFPVSGGNVNGPVNATRFAQNDYQYALEIGHYIDMHLADSTADYDGRISLDSDKKLFFNGFAIYHEGNKPSLSDIGLSDLGYGFSLLQEVDISTAVYSVTFSISAENINKYKRIIIIPKVETNQSNAILKLFADNIGSSSGPSVVLGDAYSYGNNSIAFVSFGKGGYGWGVNMMALKSITGLSTSDDVTDIVSCGVANSSESHNRPTTSPVVFKIAATGDSSYTLYGSISVLGVI